MDAASGLAELDASTQMFLPPGSTDTLVMYTENNAGTPFLTVERFDGRQWRDVSAATLPGYVNRNGSSYCLDGAGGAVQVQSLPAKKVWRYSERAIRPRGLGFWRYKFGPARSRFSRYSLARLRQGLGKKRGACPALFVYDPFRESSRYRSRAEGVASRLEGLA